MMQEPCQTHLPIKKGPFNLETGKNFHISAGMEIQKVPFEAQELTDWFKSTKRDLPWRQQPSPYAVWVSEIMLQQTQVSVVKEYYLRWMRKFPTVAALASASREEVIKMWEGLGYYSRARNLHEAAQFIVAHHAGHLPATKEALSEIKGIGPYTVGAILSFAFHQKAPAVDGNVIRVLSRYFAITEDVQERTTLKKIWELAENILPDHEPWIAAEALIELGATVCKKEPECGACPLQDGCAGYRLNVQRELPKKGKKVEITHLERHVFVIEHEGSLLITKGKKGRVMADLYEFPYAEDAAFPFSFSALKVQNLPEAQHSFTRYRVKLFPSLWKAVEKTALEDYEWISWSEIKKHPFSSGHRRILKRLDHANITH